MKSLKILLQIPLLWSIAACQTMVSEPAMSIEEAKAVVLRMQSIPLEPPARKMNDILAVLQTRQNAQREHIDAILRRADMALPKGQSPKDRYQFFKSRADARYELSRFNDCRGDIRTAIASDRAAGIGDGALRQRLAELEMLAGRYESALRLSREAASIQNLTQWRLGPYRAFQSRIHQRMGDFAQAERTLSSAKTAYGQIPAAARLSLVVDGGTLDMGNENDILAAEAELLEAQGLYGQAHPLRARILNYHYSKRRQKPIGSIQAQLSLAANLIGQKQLVQAEKAAREAVMDAVQACGKKSPVTADALQMLGKAMLAKGDLKNADILATAQIDILTDLKLSMEEDVMVRAQLFKARVRVARENFHTAMTAYDLALKGMANNRYFFRRYACQNPGLILCLIQDGRVSEAEDLIRQTRLTSLRFSGAQAPDEAQMQALEAMTLENPTEALDRFSTAVHGLATITQDPNTSFETRRLSDILLRIYADMLLEAYRPDDPRANGIDVAEELFKLADTRYSRVNSALDESSARAASLTDPVLAELVRQEQDAGKKIQSLKAVLSNAAASESGSTQSMASLERSIEALTRARTVILARIEKAFPKYNLFFQPALPGMARIQASLVPGEAFVAIWTLASKTLVWAIPQKGDPAFAVVELGEEALGQKVAVLRKSLAPDSLLIGAIPDFELGVAYDLYQRLLGPVARGWERASDLVVTVKGPLDQIPLAVFPTEPATVRPEGAFFFSGYRSVPWLIRQASITRIPSASSLVTLRAQPPVLPDREAFAGFGDPIFNTGQLEPGDAGHPRLASRGGDREKISVRGIRISELGHLDRETLFSVGIGDLCRLPDTADEIAGIAASLGADPERDIFLGTAASETRVKTEDLSRKKILAFATHALLAGDLDGLTQPALAFSSPEVTDQDEDGLLTVGDILTLKLNADLVVLSACDTGAGDGSGNEAVSGLGRAFFYSGARALLVTMWPVETTSANKLTTALFRYLQEEKTLTKTQAHRKSMLKLMDGPGLKNATTGKIVASYAHPFFWAPFVLVGEGGHPEP